MRDSPSSFWVGTPVSLAPISSLVSSGQGSLSSANAARARWVSTSSAIDFFLVSYLVSHEVLGEKQRCRLQCFAASLNGFILIGPCLQSAMEIGDLNAFFAKLLTHRLTHRATPRTVDDHLAVFR